MDAPGIAMTGEQDHALRESLPRNILDSLLEGCQVIGFDWRYLYVNEAAARQGRRPKEELLGRTMMESYPGIEDTSMFSVLRRCMNERAHDRMENEFTFPDGSTGWFELRFEPVPEGVFILSLEITERKQAEEARGRLEAQYLQAQKMEAVGRLAGGVAHDFNNLLSVILTYAGFLLDEVREGDPLRADILEIQRAGEQAASLTRQLLTFSRKQVLQPEVMDLNTVVSGMEEMLRRLIGEDIELVIRLAGDLGIVRADPGQAEQVLMNLVVNCRDAMPEGGSLVIETANVELDETYASQHAAVRPGPYVMLAVTDTGCGMDEATKARIFEPFFTTKGTEQGTGLGLATVYGIVKQSGGHVWVYSEVGRGTTFKIYLPRELAAAEAAARPLRTVTRAAGDATILLVEDEEAVRRAAQRILEAAGYTVLAAANGGEALLTCESHRGPVHLLLTDVVLPRMGGKDLAERLSKLRPGLLVLFMSGYTDDAIAHQGVLDPGTHFIPKPLNAADLTRKVREVLDG